MAEISIVQEHRLSPAQAHEAARKVADTLAREYGLACAWEQDVLRFERGGVQGTLTLRAQQAAMVIELGFLMSGFAAAIEAKVADNMRKVFGAA